MIIVVLKPHKRVPALKQFQTEKVPKKASGDDFLNLSPAWRFSLLELVDPFGWHNLTTAQLLEIRQKLANFESMTWNQIIILARDNNHLVSVDRICSDAYRRLEAVKQDDVGELLSLRLGGTERVWGILEHNAVKLLWWDPFHQICPSERKHT